MWFKVKNGFQFVDTVNSIFTLKSNDNHFTIFVEGFIEGKETDLYMDGELKSAEEAMFYAEKIRHAFYEDGEYPIDLQEMIREHHTEYGESEDAFDQEDYGQKEVLMWRKRFLDTLPCTEKFKEYFLSTSCCLMVRHGVEKVLHSCTHCQ